MTSPDMTLLDMAGVFRTAGWFKAGVLYAGCVSLWWPPASELCAYARDGWVLHVRVSNVGLKQVLCTDQQV